MGKESAKKVIVAGHICVDITPVFPSDKVKDLHEVLIPGKLIHMDGVDVHTGGAVANTGLAMKILGADVKLMGKIGDDDFGHIALNILKEHNADAGMIISKDEKTSYTIVVAPPKVDRIFLHNPGANDTFASADIQDDMLGDVALFHFGYPSLMRKMFIHDGAECILTYKRIKDNNIATSLDLTTVDADSEAGQVDWKKFLQNIIPYVDFFVPSVEELCFMLDRDRYEEWLQRAAGRDMTEVISIEKDVKPLANELLKMGAKVLLIKCGAPGVYYRTADENTLKKIGARLELDSGAWANKEGFEQSYKPDKICSATGAGDTTIAAFLTAVLKKYSLEKCMQFATATGASCVTAYDSLSGLLSFEEIENKIANGWEKQ